MFVLIPVTVASRDEAEICWIHEAKSWALVELGSGKIQNITFFDKREEVEEFIESVIVINKEDDVAPFFEESIPVLEAPVQRSIEDIIEAFMFKELYEVPIRF